MLPSVSTKGAIIKDFTFVGNDSVNRAIPHGLGRVPKHADMSFANPRMLRNIQGDLMEYIEAGGAAAASYAVTMWDKTNIYVGNVGNYAKSGNGNAVTYYVVVSA